MAKTIDQKIEEFLLGGEENVKRHRAAEEKAWNNVFGSGTGKAVSDAAKTAASAVSGSFDIISWIKSNWQLAIIGFVALLVLLRD